MLAAILLAGVAAGVVGCADRPALPPDQREVDALAQAVLHTARARLDSTYRVPDSLEQVWADRAARLSKRELADLVGLIDSTARAIEPASALAR
jgi:hypothetical protein